MNEQASPARTASQMLGNVLRTVLMPGIAAGLLSYFPGFASSANAGSSDVFLVPQRAISAPAGFSGVCSRYRWACARSGGAPLATGAITHLAKAVNIRINRQTQQIEDWEQYGQEEHWALPTTRGGDCEDMVLAKKKALIEKGVPSDTLLVATVLDRKLSSHAVLVLRTTRGDLILDNLTDQILPWQSTGYTFLKLQNPKSPRTWQAVLAGGVIKSGAAASK